MMEYWEPKQSQVVFKINEVDYQKLQKIRKIVCPDIKYTKIKFKQDIYSIGDNLLIRDSADGFLIGKLINIIPSNGDKKYTYWPTIEVEWYSF